MDEKVEQKRLRSPKPMPSIGRRSDMGSSLEQNQQHASASTHDKMDDLSQEIKKLSMEVSEIHEDLSQQVSSLNEKTDKLSEEMSQVREIISSSHTNLSQVLSLLKAQQKILSRTSNLPRLEAQISEPLTEVQPKPITQENDKQMPFRVNLSDKKSTCKPYVEFFSGKADSKKPERSIEHSTVSEILQRKPDNIMHDRSSAGPPETQLRVQLPNQAPIASDEDSLSRCNRKSTTLVDSTTCSNDRDSVLVRKNNSDRSNERSSETAPSVDSTNMIPSAINTANTPIHSQAVSASLSHSSSHSNALIPSENTIIASDQRIKNLDDQRLEPSKTPVVPISLLPVEEVHRYRNSVLVQKLMPEALQTLLGWLSHDKPPEQSFLWYVKYATNLSTEQLRKRYISALEMQTLRGNDISMLDVTLLVKLIKILAKIDDCSHEDTGHDDTSVACLLWKLKNYRNLVSHKIKTSSTNGEVFTAAQSSLLTLFSVVNIVEFKVKKEIVEDQISKLRNAFESVANTDYERQCIERQYVFRTESFKESQSYWRSFCLLEPIPFTTNIVSSEHVFHPMEIFVHQQTSTKETIFSKESYKHILKRVSKDGRKATILVGEAGSGKTTVVKNIALQFLGLINCEVDFLSEIDLLLFLECRDRFTNSVEKAIANSFPKACRKISVEKAVECYGFLGNLIIIDGYDEVNEFSAEIISQAIKLVRSMSSGQLLFTTRPHKVVQLKELLSSSGIPFTTFELVPLSEENDQIQFLQRYELNVSHNRPVFKGMVESFQALLPEVKEFFIYPINLVLFYFLYCNSRDQVSSWETSNDVIEQMLVLYEKFIARKLLERHLINLDRFIREALEEVYQFAFRWISQNKIMLSPEDMKPVQECLENKFREWQLLSKLDTTVVTSVVFLTKVIPNPTSPVVYQFYHKGIMEIMAARTFVKLMKKESDLKLNQLLLQGSNDRESVKVKLSRYENVMLFLLSYLSQPSNLATLVSRSDELLTLLQSIEVNMKYCSEILLCKPQSAPLTDLCVALVKSLDYIEVATQREYRAMTDLLAHFHPDHLQVSYNTDDEVPSSLKELLLVVKNTFLGELHLIFRNSYYSFLPLDSLVTEIMPSRFTLRSFCGCLASEKGMQSLSLQLNLLDDPLYVSVSAPRPYDHHFEFLQNFRRGSALRVRYEDPPGEQAPPCQLPAAEVSLSIADAHESKHLCGLILALAPECRTFRSITLEDCGVNINDLQKIIFDLQKAGISTSSAMSTDVEQRSFRFGFCEACNKREHPPGRRCVNLNIQQF